MDKLFPIGAFAMFVVLWIGFAMSLRGDRGLIDSAWQWLRGLPVPVQPIVWVVILPIAVGLWIYESPWSQTVGLLLALGMVAWTLVAVAALVRVIWLT